MRLKRKRRNRRPIRHAWLNDANSVAPVVHSHARGAILSRCRDRLLNPDKPDHITSYSGLLQRSSQLANALDSIGIKPGDRVATLAWDSYRHLELYFGISGMGAVCHTINPRLFVEQIVYIVNHAEDVVVFFDLAFVDLVYPLMPQCPTVEAWIYLGEAGDAKIVGAKGFPSYEGCNNRILPHDGRAVGDLVIRGAWIARLLQDAGKRACRWLVFHG